ncbi:hypothetical protein FY034_09435 [Trichlorobacter lovleyi]|uniref:hypothetical protein n=1 Tax=Trichlorobacter lovleyi TaxID=313985 RepID=UPI0022407CF7|nr:hypothetical protein [Trichlorobacter lovleyi]QOX79140.1 hypothetical protein FY034_09435 [Trichlorobacter lovleyi]
MKAKTNYSAITGIVSIGQTDVANVVSFAGGDALLKQSDALFDAGQEQDARVAIKEALKIALQRLDAVHGTGATTQAETADQALPIGCEIA